MTPEFSALLETIATTPFESAEADWRSVLKQLGLPLAHQPALECALQRSAWRTADDPGRYLRTVTWRFAVRMGLQHATRDRGGTGQRRRGGRVGGAYDDLVDPEFLDPWGWFDCDVRWDLVGERMDFNEFEINVLEARADGLSRREIMAEAESQTERRALVAAYRQVERRLPEIRDLLLGEGENILSANVAKTPKRGYREGRGEKRQ